MSLFAPFCLLNISGPLIVLYQLGLEVLKRVRVCCAASLSWEEANVSYTAVHIHVISYLAGITYVVFLIYAREIEDTILLALQSPEVYDDIARGTRCKFESNRPKAVLFEGPPGLFPLPKYEQHIYIVWCIHEQSIYSLHITNS